MSKIKVGCQAKTMEGFYLSNCSNNAKVERGGKWYCGIHDPVKIAEKRATRDEKWDRKSKLNEKKWERQNLMHAILKNKSMDELREMEKEKKNEL